MNELRPTLVKKMATLGANSTIFCGIKIGQYALIGAGSVVTKDVPDYALVVGNPGQVVGWMCLCGGKRDELMAYLKEKGIDTEIYYPVPFHLQECFRYLGHIAGDFPESEGAANGIVAIPIYPELTAGQQTEVVEAVTSYYKWPTGHSSEVLDWCCRSYLTLRARSAFNQNMSLMIGKGNAMNSLQVLRDPVFDIGLPALRSVSVPRSKS
jgi:hypothetical protein